ncbi:AfsR/SARP family transcriptional regulator [Bradyrhizobium sp. HKCCYLS1011]|uniref:AfsR/SARP family transcriptional regulator n=1 Tax=Bradyrhizobium sp. HKCCYLS1011 TaxID=3420733 RepID=UPI003EBE52B0
MLNVTLLGGISFSANGTIVKPDLGPAGRLLACYLFEFSGRVHRRERLADLFWGEIDPDKARSALNTAIWRIRKMLDLGAVGNSRRLVTIGEDVILEKSQSLHIDTHALEAASRRVLRQHQSGALAETEIQEISAAVDAYVGPFLDGCDDEWILQERERLHCLFVRSTFELMRTAAIQERYERALDFGRRILATDPLRESVQRDVMLLFVLNGQRVEAVRSYKRLVALLRAELNIAPMPETERLYGQILSGELFANIREYAQAQFGSPKSLSN